MLEEDAKCVEEGMKQCSTCSSTSHFVQGAAASMLDGGIGQGSIAEWLEGLQRCLESLNMFEREKIVMIWYEIWYARNMKWMGKQNRSIPKS